MLVTAVHALLRKRPVLYIFACVASEAVYSSVFINKDNDEDDDITEIPSMNRRRHQCCRLWMSGE